MTAVQQVCQEGDPLAMVGGPAGPSIPGATSQEILQVLCEQSISAAGRKAVGVAIAVVPGALQRLITLMQVSASSGTYMCMIDAGQAYLSRQVHQEWGSKVSPELVRRALAQCRAGKANTAIESVIHKLLLLHLRPCTLSGIILYEPLYLEDVH